jgi:hypothetical protein
VSSKYNDNETESLVEAILESFNNEGSDQSGEEVEQWRTSLHLEFQMYTVSFQIPNLIWW